MAIDASQVKELRERTGAGIMECKQALAQTQGDLEKAIDFLRQKGLSKAAKKADRVTPEGLISAYIHSGGKIGVLVEVNCETDFVARNPEFQELVKDLALQIAGAHPPPQFIQREDIPPAVLEKEMGIFYAQAKGLGKPDKVVDQIVQGKLEKFFEEVCLLEQPFIKDPGIKVRDLLTQKIAKIGENIRIRRFTRYRLGEEE
ncbi:MAG: translation elongation factor Ts [Nitrospira sp.]|nr:translation elongation factor Ts [Nitrospira sp.]